MVIFKSIAFYLALIGLIVAGSLVKVMAKTPEAKPPLIAPSANPYLNTIAASGIIEAFDKNIEIGSPEEGLILNVYVNVGEQVYKDQPLFQIDTRPLQAQLLVEQAKIKIASALLLKQQDQLNRLKSITDVRAISRDELQSKEHDVIVSEAELEAAEASVEQMNILIDRLTVRAPKDGMILQSNIRQGENVSRQMVTLLLGDLSHLQIRTDIDEQNAGKVKSEAQAVAFPKNNTSQAIPLRFIKIEPYVLPKKSLTGASDERVDTRVLQVLYAFEQPLDCKIYVGQQVDVFINLQNPENSHD